jgi:hypothetical protein
LHLKLTAPFSDLDDSCKLFADAFMTALWADDVVVKSLKQQIAASGVSIGSYEPLQKAFELVLPEESRYAGMEAIIYLDGIARITASASIDSLDLQDTHQKCMDAAKQNMKREVVDFRMDKKNEPSVRLHVGIHGGRQLKCRLVLEIPAQDLTTEVLEDFSNGAAAISQLRAEELSQ